MSELLGVELPSLELEKAPEGTVIVNSICMSIENIKLIHEILYSNVDALKKINETFGKRIDRIQFLLKNEQSMSTFKPREQNFHYIAMDSESPVTAKEFADAFHYILFQEVTINEPKEENVVLEKWQKCLVQLLVDIDLTSYCNKVANTPSTALNKNNSLCELFWQIYKEPNVFLIDFNKGAQVKIAAYFLARHFEEVKDINPLKEFNELRDHYKKAVERFLDKQQQLEQSLHLTISSLTNRIAGIESEMSRNNSNVYQCILARKILHNYTCYYEITQDTTKKSNDEFKKYKISLEDLKKPKAKKKGAQKVSKKISEYNVM